MGRRVPSEVNPLIHNHPALSLSLHIAWIAATMAIITALCGGRSKRSSPSPTASASASSMESSETTQQPTTILLPPPLQKTSEKTPQVQEQEQLPSTSKPPSPKSEEDISSNVPMIVNRTTSKRNLMVSLSMKIPGAISKIRTAREEQRQQRKEENAPQDSIWMKTIILGERCRVPSGEDDDAVIIDDKGKRVPVYQPKTPRSLPVSRTNSYIDPNALPMRRKGLLDGE